MRRIFYVLYPTNINLQRLLDGMKFLANPLAKTRAHITLRGPYNQKVGVKATSMSAVVRCRGADAFLEGEQNTVFLRCESASLVRHHKAGHYDSNPHITIYDGPSRQFAIQILNALKRSELQFDFLVDSPEPLVSDKSYRNFSLSAYVDWEFLGALAQTRNLEQAATDESRVEAIARLAGQLSRFSWRGSDLERRPPRVQPSSEERDPRRS